MKTSRLGVDLAKSVFQLHGVDVHGKAAWKRKLSRGKWVEALCIATPKGSEIGMEACASAHHWARLLTQHGYQVKLIPPQFVTPYLKSNKNDALDAEAICEGVYSQQGLFISYTLCRVYTPNS